MCCLCATVYLQFPSMSYKADSTASTKFNTLVTKIPQVCSNHRGFQNACFSIKKNYSMKVDGDIILHTVQY